MEIYRPGINFCPTLLKSQSTKYGNASASTTLVQVDKVWPKFKGDKENAFPLWQRNDKRNLVANQYLQKVLHFNSSIIWKKLSGSATRGSLSFLCILVICICPLWGWIHLLIQWMNPKLIDPISLVPLSVVIQDRPKYRKYDDIKWATVCFFFQISTQ